jgi:3-methylcrotonyl-CoA carboxylase alpha subunit
VKAQLKCAQGESTGWEQDKIKHQGHSIECRLYAEDPYQDGIPSVGLIGSCEFPEAPGRRFEVGFDKGDVITSFYDSMIAKVIVWDETREKTIDKMISTLKSTVVFGLQTNIPYLIEILDHPEFRSGEMTTQFISKYFSESLKPIELTPAEKEFAKQATQKMTIQKPQGINSSSINSPWNTYWRGI